MVGFVRFGMLKHSTMLTSRATLMLGYLTEGATTCALKRGILFTIHVHFAS